MQRRVTIIIAYYRVVFVILYCTNVLAFYEIWQPSEQVVKQAMVRADRFCRTYFDLKKEKVNIRSVTNEYEKCSSVFKINGVANTNYYKNIIPFEMFTNEKTVRYIAVQYYPKKYESSVIISSNVPPFTVYVGIDVQHVGLDIDNEIYVGPVGITPFFLGAQGCCGLRKAHKNADSASTNSTYNIFMKPEKGEVKVIDSQGVEVNDF